MLVDDGGIQKLNDLTCRRLSRNVPRDLQTWYASQCDGGSEHAFGITIETLDNPGWTLKVQLTDTKLEGATFPTQPYGVGADAIVKSSPYGHPTRNALLVNPLPIPNPWQKRHLR